MSLARCDGTLEAVANLRYLYKMLVAKLRSLLTEGAVPWIVVGAALGGQLQSFWDP